VDFFLLTAHPSLRQHTKRQASLEA